MSERFTNDFDRVIDEIARELTAGEPGAAFRRRVLARIASGARARRRWRAAWMAAPLAAAALIAVAVAATLYRSPALQQAQGTPSASSGERLALQRPEEPRTANPEPRTTNSEPGTQHRAPGTRTLNPEPRTLNPVASAVAALAPTPVSIDSIALAPIAAADSLELQQLEPPPSLAVAPLDPGELEKEIRR